MSNQPSLSTSYRNKGFVQRRLARFVCWLFSSHDFIEVSKGHVEELSDGKHAFVYKCNKLVCRDCGYET
jgi:hypothetical protein